MATSGTRTQSFQKRQPGVIIIWDGRRVNPLISDLISVRLQALFGARSEAESRTAPLDPATAMLNSDNKCHDLPSSTNFKGPGSSIASHLEANIHSGYKSWKCSACFGRFGFTSIFSICQYSWNLPSKFRLQSQTYASPTERRWVAKTWNFHEIVASELSNLLEGMLNLASGLWRKLGDFAGLDIFGGYVWRSNHGSGSSLIWHDTASWLSHLWVTMSSDMPIRPGAMAGLMSSKMKDSGFPCRHA